VNEFQQQINAVRKSMMSSGCQNPLDIFHLFVACAHLSFALSPFTSRRGGNGWKRRAPLGVQFACVRHIRPRRLGPTIYWFRSALFTVFTSRERNVRRQPFCWRTDSGRVQQVKAKSTLNEYQQQEQEESRHCVGFVVC